MNNTWKQKLDNFWYYYKFHCLIALVALLGVWLVFDFVTQPVSDLNISLTSIGSLSEETINFNEALPGLIVDANHDGMENITISRQFIGEDAEGKDSREHYSKLLSQLSEKGATLYIMDKVNFDRMIKKDAFSALDEWMDVASYGDRVIYRGDSPVALSLKGSRILADMKFTDDDLYGLILFTRPEDANDAFTQAQYENAAKVLAALMEQA